ncbi:hypothetical protein [Gemmatimonas sp.]|uniref:hypothetical protein n=1 Tax=Gemmatimonas sp. TaxID=1962908 RepID=UPI0033406C32
MYTPATIVASKWSNWANISGIVAVEKHQPMLSANAHIQLARQARGHPGLVLTPRNGDFPYTGKRTCK